MHAGGALPDGSPAATLRGRSSLQRQLNYTIRIQGCIADSLAVASSVAEDGVVASVFLWPGSGGSGEGGGGLGLVSCHRRT